MSIKEKTKQMLESLYYFASSHKKIIFEGDSEYNHIIVSENKGHRLLAFGPNGQEHETAYNVNKPDEPLFEYPSLMCPALALKADTKEILMIGLGGAYLPGVIKRNRPDITITSIEIDPLVAQVAQEFFGYQAKMPTPLIIADGRDYLEKNETQYDQIWLDAYNGAYIPQQLTTFEFLKLCQRRLKPWGVISQNVHLGHSSCQLQINTISEIFGHVYQVTGINGANAALIVQKDVYKEPLPISEAFNEGLNKYGEQLGLINLRTEINKITLHIGSTGTKILTDAK